MIQITDKTQCCGCTACVSVCAHGAITMQPDNEGFIYPVVDIDTCTKCGLCETVCPIIQRKGVSQNSNQKLLYAARAKDKETLLDSSSGGAFMAICKLVIEKGGIVCGVEYSSEMEVRHAFAETLDGCKRFMGSKYVQSNIDGIFKQIKIFLKQGRYVLFSGTPCQVEGLKLYLKREYASLITVDVVCHAVPSPLIFREYVSFVNEKFNAKLLSIDMRYKRICGWSHRFSYRYSFHTGKTICDPANVSNWGRLYFSRLIDRPSCHACMFTNYYRSGDFTIADFWDDKKLRPELHSKDGTSLLLVNSGKGVELMENICKNLDVWEINLKEAWQPCLEKPTSASPLRESFWKDYHSKGYHYVYRRYFTDSVRKKIKQGIKNTLFLLGIWKRNE